MEDLKARLKALADRIDAMSVRERGMIFFAVMGFITIVAYSAVFGPLGTEQARLETDVRTMRDRALKAETDLNALVTGQGTTVAANQAKLEALKQNLRDLDVRMDRMTAGVVTPKEMAKLVEQMLARNKGLRLVKLEALPPMPIDQAPSADGSVPVAASTASMYRHGMRVEFKGTYFDIIEYLKSLESMPWKVFWGEISLASDKYPVSKVTLVIYTLSRHPAWIGV